MAFSSVKTEPSANKDLLSYSLMTSMYYGYDTHNIINLPLNTFAKLARQYIEEPFLPFAYLKPGKVTAAQLNMFERSTHQYTKPEWNIIQSIDRNGNSARIEINKILKKDFCTLLHFSKHYKKKLKLKEIQPIVLVVAPYSGHYATLLRDTVTKMLEDHDVYVTDWHNAREVSLYKGIFAFDDYVQYLKEFLVHISQPVHIIAVCQPAVPVLVTTALMAQENSLYQPLSITLMGGPIDTRVNPTAVNKIAKQKPYEWFENNIIGRVPYYYEGGFRRVIPGFIMLAGFMQLNLERHVSAPYKLYQYLVQGDGSSAQYHQQFYDEYRAVLDLPADYYLDSIRIVFQEHLLPKEKLKWRGNKVDLKAICKTALMTVEGEKDDISGPGQTYAAHELCKNIPSQKQSHYLQAQVGHYGVFSGRKWRELIQPKIANFIVCNNK